MKLEELVGKNVKIQFNRNWICGSLKKGGDENDFDCYYIFTEKTLFFKLEELQILKIEGNVIYLKN